MGYANPELHREHRRAYSRAYYLANREAQLAKQKLRRAQRPRKPPRAKETYLRGPAHPGWKGDAAGTMPKRDRAVRLYSLVGVPCEDCGAPATDRHHIDGDTGNNERSNLAFLCRRCHMTRDGRRDALIALAKAPRELAPPRPCETCHRMTEVRRLAKGECHRCRMFTYRTGRKWAPPPQRVCKVCATTEMPPKGFLCVQHAREQHAAYERARRQQLKEAA